MTTEGYDIAAGKNDEVRKWLNRLMVSRKAREMHFDEKATRNVDYFKGNQNMGDLKDGKVPLNFVWSFVKTFVPAVYARNPKVRILPKLKQGAPPEILAQKRRLAKMFEILTNMTLDEIKLKRSMKRAIQDAALMGRGVIKVGYNAQAGKTTGDKYEISKAGAESSGIPLDANMEDSFLVSEKVWAKRVSPLRCFYDCDAINMEAARWVAHEVVVPVEYVRKNRIYGAKAQSVKASTIVDKEYLDGISGVEGGEYNTDSVPGDFGRVCLTEIWDKETRYIYVLAKGNEDLGFLREIPWPFKKLEGFPFEELVFNDVPDEQWPISEVDQFIDAQDEMNILRDHMATYFKRFFGIMLADQSKIDDKMLQKIANSQLQEIIPVNNPVGALVPFTSPSLINEHLTRDRILKADMEENSGLPSWRRAGNRIGARSATEVSEITQGLDVKDNEKVDVVQDFSREVIRKLVQIMQEKYTISKVVPMTGELGLEWRNFSVQDIQEELSVDVVPYSATPATPDLERAQYMQFLQIATSVAQVVPGVINMPVLLRDIAEKLQITNIDEIMPMAMPANPQDAGMQQVMAQAVAQGQQGMNQPAGAPPPNPAKFLKGG